MGRKIKGKKHRTVKDPAVQRAVRDERLKWKINNPPKNLDDQEIPKSLLRIIHLKEQANKFKGAQKKKKMKRSKLLSVERLLDKDQKQPGMNKPDKFIPLLEQNPWESVENFSKRVHFMARNIQKETEFENKFSVDIQKDMNTGQVLKVTREKSSKKSKKKKLSEKRKEKKKVKNDEKSVIVKDFNMFKDEVKFGERVDRPPVNLPKLKTKNVDLQSKLQQEKSEMRRLLVVKQYRQLKKVNQS